jgi:hypothetical protein
MILHTFYNEVVVWLYTVLDNNKVFPIIKNVKEISSYNVISLIQMGYDLQIRS